MSVRGTPHATPRVPRAPPSLARFAAPRWSAPAWGAIGVTALFVALSCWWLSQDRAMPYSDAASHLLTALRFHDRMAQGDLLVPFTYELIYTPLTQFVGALGIFVGGRTVAAPVIAENLVYVPLLALACYRVGRRAFGPAAGFLAVVFALGSPLIAEQFHVLMLDAPLAALVATSVWLILESDRFERRNVALLAGVAAGFGMLAKQSFPLYLVGLVPVVLLRGEGWRNWRGLAVFLLAALAVCAPWYAYHASHLDTYLGAAGTAASVPPLAKPPLLSSDNLLWYFWALANGLLFVPLLAFAAVGLGVSGADAVRRPSQPGVVPELVAGLVGAWAAITALPHHDVRYTLPLIVFLAVLGTGWVVRLARVPRAVATAALAAAVCAATLGATFGVGPPSSAVLPSNRAAPDGEGVPPLETLTVYSNHDFMVSGPRNGGDLLALLKDLRREGVRQIVWQSAAAPPSYVDFNNHGLITFAKMARLRVPFGILDLTKIDRRSAVLIAGRTFDGSPPCVRLRGGTNLWIRLGNPSARGVRDFCPRFDPPLYGP